MEVFGYPITEWITLPDGRIIQFFQRMGMEWHPDAAPGQRMRPMRLGTIYVESFIDPEMRMPESIPSYLSELSAHSLAVSSLPTAAPSAIQSPTPTAMQSPTPTAIQALTLTPTPVVVVEAEWPQRMETERLDSIRVSLVSRSAQAVEAEVEVEGHTAVVETPIPQGTPGMPMPAAFDKSYKAFAVARLGAPLFDCDLTSQEVQPLEQLPIDWVWTCYCEKPGPQIVDVSISVQWRQPADNIVAQERQVWRKRLYVSVKQPWVRAGQLSIITIVSGFLGSLLSAPWLYDRVKQIIEKWRKAKEAEPSILVARR